MEGVGRGGGGAFESLKRKRLGKRGRGRGLRAASGGRGTGEQWKAGRGGGLCGEKLEYCEIQFDAK